jgi:hypothetical protein
VPLSIYRFNMGGIPYLTSNLTLPFETNVIINGNLYPQPHWWLTTSNDLQVIIMDTAVSPYRIIDYVQLGGPDSSRDLTSEIISDYDTATGPSGNDLWDTNFVNGFPIPIGLDSQIGVSLGVYTPGLGSDAWNNPDATTRHNEIDGFRLRPALQRCRRAAGHDRGCHDQHHASALHALGDGRPTFLMASKRSSDSLHRQRFELGWCQ